MKKLIYQGLFFWGLAIMVFSACEEVGPPIDFTPVDTSLLDTTYVTTTLPATQQRVVLIEEHTGVRCPNCPAGHVITKNISTANPGRVAVVALHNYFADVAAGPLSGSTDTLYIDEATEILTAQGSPFGWPAGTVNRKVYPGQTSVIIGASLWSGNTDAELLEDPIVNLELLSATIDADDSLTVLAKVVFLEDVTEPVGISLMVTENEIIQPQDVDGTIDDFYVHEHVVRDMMTPPLGTAMPAPTVTAPTIQGRVFEREFRIKAPLKWDRNHLEIVGFIHYTGSSQEVLQAAKVDVM